jgi:hypothetical protein
MEPPEMQHSRKEIILVVSILNRKKKMKND